MEQSIRAEKLTTESVQKEKEKMIKTIGELELKLKDTKPYQQELQQRIAYWERVNLELERKMEDFNRREHEYKKEVQHYKSSLAKMTADRNKNKASLEEKIKILDEKLEYIRKL